MQSTAPRSVRAFMSKIHQQLPLSTRESHRLLDVLTQSFESQLDKHHPAPTSSSKSKSDVARALPEPARRLSTPTSAYETAENHVHSLLSHPVLSGKASLPSTSSLPTSTDPLDIIRGQITAGRLTLSAFRDCILALDVNHAGNQPFSDVLQWTISSGQLTADEIYSDSALAAPLIQHLIAEGNKRAIKSWLLGTSSEQPRRMQVLVRYVRNLTAVDGNANRATKDFLGFIRQGSFDIQTLHVASRALVKVLVRQGGGVMSKAYNVALTARITDWSIYPDLDSAILHMYNPSTTQPLTPALNVILHPTGLKQRFPRASKQILAFSLTVARQLLANGDLKQAERVIRAVSTQFATELGLDQVSRIQSVVDSQRSDRPDDDVISLLDGHLKAMLKLPFG